MAKDKDKDEKDPGEEALEKNEQQEEEQEDQEEERSVARRGEDDDGSDTRQGEDADERQARRRQERHEAKVRRREAIGRKDRHISLLERTVQEQANRLAALEDRTAGGDMARLNAAIENAGTEVELAKSARTEAMKANDPVIFDEADTILHNARRKHEELTNLKSRIEQGHRQRSNGGGGERTAVTVDPRVVSQAQAWARRNKWFDPAATDMDSKIVKMIDRDMHTEGWDPITKEYWEELDARVAERIPKRTSQKKDPEDDEDELEEPPRRRSITGGAGGDSPGGRSATHTLSPERVQALKDANMWDDPKTRARMIKKYQAHDKEHAQDTRR